MSVVDEEVERLRAEVSCAVVLERSPDGWTLDKEESTKRCLKYRSGARIVIVNHEGKGWWDPGSEAKGDVFALVQHLDRRLNFGQVRQALRKYIGQAPAYPAFVRGRRSKHADEPPDVRWASRPRLHRGSRTWRYLAETRCLPSSVLSAAGALDAIREGPYGSAWFAHRDHAGAITGIEMRGRDYYGFTPAGRKTLFRLPGSNGVITRLSVFEAPIDAMSLAAIERMRADTLYVSTTGGMGPDTLAELRLLMAELKCHPCGKLVIATDNDAPGERYAAALKAMAAEIGLPSDRSYPDEGRKDWNEALQARARGAGR